MNRRLFIFSCLGMITVPIPYVFSKNIQKYSWHRYKDGWRRITSEGFKLTVMPIEKCETNYPDIVSKFHNHSKHLWHIRITGKNLKTLELYPASSHTDAINKSETVAMKYFLRDQADNVIVGREPAERAVGQRRAAGVVVVHPD